MKNRVYDKKNTVKESNMLKKSIILFMVMVFLTVPFAFSGGQEEEAGEDVVTIDFWFPSANKANDAYFNSMGPKFMESNPNIKVETTVVPSSSADIMQKLNTAKLSGTYPDVFSAFLVYLGTRGARGEFLDLQPYVDQWEDKNDIPESVYNMGKYKGTLVGLGFFPAPVIRVFRKDFFAEAGLDPDKGPSNWEELRSMAMKASVYDSSGDLQRAGMDLPSQDLALVFTEPFMRQAGSKVIDEVAQEPSFTDDGAVQALEYLTDLHQENVSFPHEWVEFDTHPFQNNRSAMGNIMTSHIMNMIGADPSLKEKFGYAPVLEGPVQQKAFCGQRYFVIGADSEHPDESWEFVKFLMSSDEMWTRYEKLAIPPVRKSLEEDYIADNPRRNSVILDYVIMGKGKAITPWTNIANTYMKQAYEEALSGRKTARQALTDADKGLREELKTFKLE
jgi:ABC-type glycerol-3-phosphate transport system substrate-binding protein